MTEKTKVSNSTSAQELEKLDQQIKAFDENIKELSQDRMNSAPMQELEPQVKRSQQELENEKQIRLKPIRSISSREKFNEKFRKDYEFASEMVCFECENHEIIGEKIEKWTKPFPGMPAQFWEVPVNKPVWGPRFLAEEIAKKYYHRFVMDETRPTEQNKMGVITGAMIVDMKKPRLSARPVTQSRKTIFTGSF